MITVETDSRVVSNIIVNYLHSTEIYGKFLGNLPPHTHTHLLPPHLEFQTDFSTKRIFHPILVTLVLFPTGLI